MSRIVYEPIGVRETRDADRVNDIYAAFEAATADIDERNLAEEGLDRTVLVAGPLELVGEQTDGTRTNIATTAGLFVKLTMSGDLRTGALGALTADEAIRVRYRVNFETTLAAGLGIQAAVTDLRLRAAWNNGTTTAKVDWSERPCLPGANNLRHGIVFGEGWIFGAQATVAWAEIQILVAGASVNPGTAGIWCTKHRRMARV